MLLAGAGAAAALFMMAFTWFLGTVERLVLDFAQNQSKPNFLNPSRPPMAHQRNVQVARSAHVAQGVEPHKPEVAGYQGIPDFALPDGAEVHGVGIAAALEVMQRMAVGRQAHPAIVLRLPAGIGDDQVFIQKRKRAHAQPQDGVQAGKFLANRLLLGIGRRQVEQPRQAIDGHQGKSQPISTAGIAGPASQPVMQIGNINEKERGAHEHAAQHGSPGGQRIVFMQKNRAADKQEERQGKEKKQLSQGKE